MSTAAAENSQDCQNVIRTKRHLSLCLNTAYFKKQKKRRPAIQLDSQRDVFLSSFPQRRFFETIKNLACGKKLSHSIKASSKQQKKTKWPSSRSNERFNKNSLIPYLRCCNGEFSKPPISYSDEKLSPIIAYT